MFVYKFSLGHIFLILLGEFLGVKLLGQKVTRYQTIWGTARLFFRMAAPFAT